MALDDAGSYRGNRRFTPGSNLPPATCGSWLEDDTRPLRCNRTAGHEGPHRRGRRQWTDEGEETTPEPVGPRRLEPDAPAPADLLEHLEPPAGVTVTEAAAVPLGSLLPPPDPGSPPAHLLGVTPDWSRETVEPLVGGLVDPARVAFTVEEDPPEHVYPLPPALLEHLEGRLHVDAGTGEVMMEVPLDEDGTGTLEAKDQTAGRFLPASALPTIIGRYYEAEDAIAAEALAAAVRGAGRVLFRSVEWDGPPPAAGDVLLASFGAYVLTSVAYGAGLGHYRLEARPARMIRWAGARPERA